MRMGVRRFWVACVLLVLAGSGCTGDAGVDSALAVGLALRWQIRVAGVPPLVFWTTRVQNFKVGEVQVPNEGPRS
jgi:hypothetical protein